MNDFIPPFELQRVLVEPWTQSFSSFIWIAVMGFLVTAACGLIGNYLLLRRMALVGDAISHSVLPGLVLAFLVSNSRGSMPMFIGALAAGVLTTILIEVIHKRSRVKQDAAIGITFSTLFAIGVILVTLYADRVDLDQECVLYGEIAFIPLEPFAEIGSLQIAPVPVVVMAVVTALTLALIVAFYKELLVSSFDAGLAASLGVNATVMHYALMSMLSVVVVSAFESVGAILVIAMLILPGATASLICHHLPSMLGLSVVHAALSALLGIHLAVWLECSVAGAMVVMGTVLFFLAWLFTPSEGLVMRLFRRRKIAVAEVDNLQMAT